LWPRFSTIIFLESFEGDLGFSCNGESGVTTSAVLISSGMESDDRALLPRCSEQLVFRPLELRPRALSVGIQIMNRKICSDHFSPKCFLSPIVIGMNRLCFLYCNYNMKKRIQSFQGNGYKLRFSTSTKPRISSDLRE
jgi:hypothetical protein